MLFPKTSAWRKTRRLFGSHGEDAFACHLEFDSERRAQIGSLHNRSARPNTPRKIAHFERVEYRAAARVPNHGMFRRVKAVILGQLCQVGQVFQLAIPEGRIRGKRPVAARLRRGTAGKTNEQCGNILAGQSIANKKLFGRPGLGHFRNVGDSRIGGTGVWQQSAWIGRGRGNFDLRLLFGGARRRMLRAKSPARSQKNDEKNDEKSDDKFDGGIRSGSGARTRNAGNLRHLRFEAVRWRLVGHWAELRFYTQAGRVDSPQLKLKEGKRIEPRIRGCVSGCSAPLGVNSSQNGKLHGHGSEESGRREFVLTRYIPRGLGCVANTRVRNRRFWKCGNSWTYGRIFGSVAMKGVRREGETRLNVGTLKRQKGPPPLYVFVKD